MNVEMPSMKELIKQIYASKLVRDSLDRAYLIWNIDVQDFIDIHNNPKKVLKKYFK